MLAKTGSKEIVNYFLDNNVLLSSSALDFFLSFDDFISIEQFFSSFNFSYLNNDLLQALKENKEVDANWKEFEKLTSYTEKGKDKGQYDLFLKYLLESKTSIEEKKDVVVVSSYPEISEKREVHDFTMYFHSRLKALQKILYKRDELNGVTSISRILAKRDRENVSLIGLVKEKRMTKNNNLILMLEDDTGEINVLINKNKPDIYEQAKDIVPDEVIGVGGVNGDNIVFANTVLWPDIPATNELKKCDEEAYALFLSDLHIGSDKFLDGDFNRFLSWINQETGNDHQKEMASKVKYIFIVGDLIDGVGIYPGQEEDLTILDVNEQYSVCAELLSKIPERINLVICAGNHDSLRIAEPQPILPEEFCAGLYNLPNVTFVSNPSIVNIHSSDSFDGYNVLLYHGYSFDYYVANVDSIRNNGGYDRADLIMKFLLKRRHLAPTHTSTLYVPYSDTDPLVVDIIPDFFVTGHIHKSAVASYRNITLICGSCWQAKTDFQEKVGHHPEPSRVPAVNLATREVKLLRFGK